MSRAEISEADLAGGGPEWPSLDELRIVRLGETLDFQDQTFGTGLVSANTVALTLHEGLSGLGASTTGDRPGTRLDFFKLTGEVTRVQNLFGFSGGLRPLHLAVGRQYFVDIAAPQ